MSFFVNILITLMSFGICLAIGSDFVATEHRLTSFMNSELESKRNPMSSSPSQPNPFLSSYDIEDSCQYEICGPRFAEEFGDSNRKRGSCSNACDASAHRLINSRFKKEFLWGKCTSMCLEKYNFHNFESFQERIGCMDECFEAFEYVKPHHKIARACVHAACSSILRQSSGEMGLVCFARCTRHVATNVPQEDWPTWASLLSRAKCPVDRQNLDQLACADRSLWVGLTRRTAIAPDVHLLCLNAMCDNNVRCAKQCLSHVTSVINPEDLSRWQQCTYAAACAKIADYSPRVKCADDCLEKLKLEAIKVKERLLTAESEARRKREKEASALATSAAATALVQFSWIHLFTLFIGFIVNGNRGYYCGRN